MSLDLTLDLSGKSVSDILNFLNQNLNQSDYSNELLAVSFSAFYKIRSEFDSRRYQPRSC